MRQKTSNRQENFPFFSMTLYLFDDPDSVRHYLSGNPDQVRHYVTGIPDSVRYYASGNPDGNPKSIHCARGVMLHDSPPATARQPTQDPMSTPPPSHPANLPPPRVRSPLPLYNTIIRAKKMAAVAWREGETPTTIAVTEKKDGQRMRAGQ